MSQLGATIGDNCDLCVYLVGQNFHNISGTQVPAWAELVLGARANAVSSRRQIFLVSRTASSRIFKPSHVFPTKTSVIQNLLCGAYYSLETISNDRKTSKVKHRFAGWGLGPSVNLTSNPDLPMSGHGNSTNLGFTQLNFVHRPCRSHECYLKSKISLPARIENQRTMSSGKEVVGSKPRAPSRFITTNNAQGLSTFTAALPDSPPSRRSPDGMEIAFCYGTNQTPPTFEDEVDIAAYEHLIANPPGIVIRNGCVARLIDFPPGYMSPMHRTISLNYNFVIQGKVELILDSGETRELLPGDMAVQRAVNHAWRNMSTTEWARITAFAVPAVAPQQIRDAHAVDTI